MENEITFEQINDHINKADLSQYQKGAAGNFRAADVKTDAGGVLQKVCGIYHVIRPILQAILKIPFIPEKWKEVIKTFIGLMDTLCP
ncbi:MAG: hypothetical protein ABI419_04315 [Ginsengibacter sp.]